jgi:hypothetical protein
MGWDFSDGQQLLPKQNNLTSIHYCQLVPFGLVIFVDFLCVQTGTNLILPASFSPCLCALTLQVSSYQSKTVVACYM